MVQLGLSLCIFTTILGIGAAGRLLSDTETEIEGTSTPSVNITNPTNTSDRDGRDSVTFSQSTEVTEDYYIPDDSNHVKKEDATTAAAIQSFHDFDAINDDFEPFHDTKEDMVDKKDPEWAPVDVKENKPPIVRRSTKTQVRIKRKLLFLDI